MVSKKTGISCSSHCHKRMHCKNKQYNEESKLRLSTVKEGNLSFYYYVSSFFAIAMYTVFIVITYISGCNYLGRDDTVGEDLKETRGNQLTKINVCMLNIVIFVAHSCNVFVPSEQDYFKENWDYEPAA